MSNEITKRDENLLIGIPLSKEELAETMDDLCEILGEVEELEEELAEIKKKFGGQIKEKVLRAKQLRKNYEEKASEQEVDCMVEFHWKAGKKKIYNKGTGKLVKTEDITEDDRQEKLDLETHGQPLNQKPGEEVLNIIQDNDISIEVKDGDKFKELKFSALKMGHLFRMVKAGKIVKFDKRSEFTAIDKAVKGKDGVLAVKAQ